MHVKEVPDVERLLHEALHSSLPQPDQGVTALPQAEEARAKVRLPVGNVRVLNVLHLLFNIGNVGFTQSFKLPALL